MACRYSSNRNANSRKHGTVSKSHAHARIYPRTHGPWRHWPKLKWLPKLITGEWAGTMNLTEPQAGSDVGALTTKAELQDDGSYLITGQKKYT